ncbi:MAG TPA: hypothetical protein VMT82_08295 [candidate division Zixibacteria bacterium]|nr:hypothetical protein [candidate division Zixibacteria bacterium]
MSSCPRCNTPQSWRQLILIAALYSTHCSGCGKNLRLSRASRTIGLACGVAAGFVIGHALRTAPWGLNLTVIAVTVFGVSSLVSLACAKLRPAQEDGIVVDSQPPDSD